MPLEKSEILKEFSARPEQYYAVQLFEDKGFERRSCAACGRFFWTTDPARTLCPDDAPDTYGFIGDPPTARRFDYAESWQQIRDFFSQNGHGIIGRYPVVCRWRDDLYFTIASIVDFQRVMGSKVVFEFPANPLVVPQTCLRFKDLENVGVTGRHFSSFCMVGQHSVPDVEGGYWKDECIALDYSLLTGPFGISPEEIVFVEDVWAGGGSFGPSLEYFVRGLELGNAVFTEFQGDLGSHSTLERRVIDMGAGLERFAWITMGTPTAYDCCFGGVDAMIRDALGVEIDDPVMLGRYYTEVAKMIEKGDDLWDVRRLAMKKAGMAVGGVDDNSISSSILGPIEDSYMIADHVRTLVFAISDGALPSNVGGGYNLRMMIRRIGERLHRLKIPSRTLGLDELVDAHIDYLRTTYPELDSRRDDIKKIIHIESGRYAETRSHVQKKVARMQERRGTLGMDELVTLYDSDGIAPEYLAEQGVIPQVPSDFYSRVSEMHTSERKEAGADAGSGGAGDTVAIPDDIPDTQMLFYGDDPQEFEAVVVWSYNNMVILDRTSFYARGGGQEPDRGVIDGHAVADVQKHAGIILHVLARAPDNGMAPAAGKRVRCSIDSERRRLITAHHTSTHILNASSRRVLGSWVWQHSAFKDADHARLDITHHSPLTGEQVQNIEDAANRMVEDNLPVTIAYMDRGEAEQKYGFSIYQGGVVPVKAVRIVSISDVDTEACGGTHVSETGQIKKIRITRTKRIQDGVVRLEFVSGSVADDYDAAAARVQLEEQQKQKERDEILRMRDSSKTEAQNAVPDVIRGIVDAVDSAGLNNDHICDTHKKITALDAPHDVRVFVVKRSTKDSGPLHLNIMACIMAPDCAESRDERFHNLLGKKMTKDLPNSAYVGFFRAGSTVRVVAYAGSDAVNLGRIDVSNITAAASAILGGGSSRGNPVFSQGGGTATEKIMDAARAAESVMRGALEEYTRDGRC